MNTTKIVRLLQPAIPSAHTLVRPSPWVRQLGATPPISHDLENDFQLYPDFFSPSEVERLVKMSLWKLDRADSTRRRRGRGAASACDAEGVQKLFESVDKYGFEEVMTNSTPRAHTRDISTLSSTIIEKHFYRHFHLLPTRNPF